MICVLYNAKNQVNGNNARQMLFSQLKKGPLPESLPPMSSVENGVKFSP